MKMCTIQIFVETKALMQPANIFGRDFSKV